MPIRVFLPAAHSLACLCVEAKKREEREGGSWDTQKRRRRSRRSSSSKGAHEKKKGRVKLRKLTPPLEC
jgi:hypothetical protein